jgi:hypothetical protein
MDDPSKPDGAGRLFDEPLAALLEDAKEAFKRASEDPSDHSKRGAFRVAFSTIEGIAFLLRNQVLVDVYARPSMYSNAEVPCCGRRPTSATIGVM